MDTFAVPILGMPNSGKSTLYNKLTGSKSSTANFPGVSQSANSKPLLKNKSIKLVDLPGFYKFDSEEPESKLATGWLQEFSKKQKQAGKSPVLMCVLDGYILAEQLDWLIDVTKLGTKLIIVVNKHDMLIRNNAKYDLEALAKQTGGHVALVSAKSGSGLEQIISLLNEEHALYEVKDQQNIAASSARNITAESLNEKVILNAPSANQLTADIDKVMLNPIFGVPAMLGVMILMFQLVFVVAEGPIGWIERAVGALDDLVIANISNGLLSSFLSEAILGGVGTVLIFLPPILLVSIFLNILEQSGYISRMSTMFDGLLVKTGLGGYSIFPLLVGFSCAIPAIYSARAIPNKQARMLAMTIIPVIPCSARLPVYTLIISAFVPVSEIYGFNLQGLALFGIYSFGLFAAVILAWLLSKSLMPAGKQGYFAIELPNYQLPELVEIWQICVNRMKIFIVRVGTLITLTTVVMWVLLQITVFGDTIEYSIAGWLGQGLSLLFAPMGFNWEIATALIPGTLIAREVVVSTLAVIYGTSEDGLTSLVSLWNIPTTLAFLLWQVLAPQCLPTYLTMSSESTRRQTLKSYFLLFGFSYVACTLVYQVARLVI